MLKNKSNIFQTHFEPFILNGMLSKLVNKYSYLLEQK